MFLMKRSESPPDYLIKAIVRHASILINEPHETIKQMEAARLLKKEISKLGAYAKDIQISQYI